MHLCVTFGEPSPRKLLDRMTASELQMWRNYMAMFALPSELPHMLASAMSIQYSSKESRRKPGDFMLFYQPPVRSETGGQLAQSMRIIAQTMKAKNGTS